MNRVLSACVFVVFSSPSFAGTPIEAVQFFYNDPGEELNMANIERFTGSAKTQLEGADKTNDGAEGPCIGFMLSVDGQDFDEAELKNSLNLSQAKAGDQATVVARFMSFEEEHEVLWTMEQIDGDWKVADISSKASDWTLSKFECATK